MMFKPYLTLVADDSEDEQILITRSLKSLPNVRVIGCVNDGIEAVMYLEGAGRFSDRRKFPFPDLLLLDYQMPRLDGMEVLGVLKAEKIRVRVILWSNSVFLLDQEVAKELGASVICQKPMIPAEMAEIINRLDWPVAESFEPAFPERFSLQALKA